MSFHVLRGRIKMTVIIYFLIQGTQHSACHLTRFQHAVASSPCVSLHRHSALLASLFPIYEMELRSLEPGSWWRKSTRGISRALEEG